MIVEFSNQGQRVAVNSKTVTYINDHPYWNCVHIHFGGGNISYQVVDNSFDEVVAKLNGDDTKLVELR